MLRWMKGGPMDERVKNALSLMLDALLHLDDAREYRAAAHLQLAIDVLTKGSEIDGTDSDIRPH